MSSTFDSNSDRLLYYENGFSGEPPKMWSLFNGQWSEEVLNDGPNLGGMVFDPNRNRSILVPFSRGETWEWNGIQWILREAFTPAFAQPRLVYDPVQQRTLMAAGIEDQNRIEIWSWNGSLWSFLADGPSQEFSPMDRSFGFTLDTQRNQLAIYGGQNDTRLVNAIGTWIDQRGWEWSGGPEGRRDPGFVFDPSRGKGVLIGGETASGPSTEVFE